MRDNGRTPRLSKHHAGNSEDGLGLSIEMQASDFDAGRKPFGSSFKSHAWSKKSEALEPHASSKARTVGFRPHTQSQGGRNVGFLVSRTGQKTFGTPSSSLTHSKKARKAALEAPLTAPGLHRIALSRRNPLTHKEFSLSAPAWAIQNRP
jgi:ribosomal protein L34